MQGGLTTEVETQVTLDLGGLKGYLEKLLMELALGGLRTLTTDLEGLRIAVALGNQIAMGEASLATQFVMKGEQIEGEAGQNVRATESVVMRGLELRDQAALTSQAITSRKVRVKLRLEERTDMR